MPDTSFALASADVRLCALFDQAPARIRRHRALIVANGEIADRNVAVAATDASMQRGAIGIEEGHALAQLFADACASGTPVVLALDSAGARVDEDLAALGAFRRLFRAALEARLAGVPMLALLGRSCFGGASLLACLCGQRSYLPQTLLAASGPRVIEAAEGRDRFDASDTSMVRAHLGTTARLAWHEKDGARADTLDSAMRTVRNWIVQPPAAAPELTGQQSRLEGRLAARSAAIHDRADLAPSLLDALLPPGYVPSISGRLLQALPDSGAGKPVFVGALGGGPLDAQDSARLSRSLLELGEARPSCPIVLLLDASAHAASVRDEDVLLSDYLVHLSLVIAMLAGRGHRIALWIVGQASGASYVAFAAPAHSVSAAGDARIEILPPAARETIVGTRGPVETGVDTWLESHVADALLEKRVRMNPKQCGEAST